MAAIDIFIDLDRELEYIRKELGDLHRRAPVVLRTAINKTAAEAKKRDDRITGQTYTAKRDINRLEHKKATTANLQAILSDKGENISMTHFKYRAGKRGISVLINKTHGYKKVEKHDNPAFYAMKKEKGGKVGKFIAVRYGKQRLPIEKLLSISSPVMHGNKNTWGKIEPDIEALLHKNVRKELERVLSK